MTIFIDNLQVQNLGPIESLQESLGQVNLIYGLNESGKTYLVEFLLHSLFRQSKSWDLRKSIGKGSVQVQGLGPEPITFSPESSRKIEHFWEEDGGGLPLNMARLLVVKGGELSLSAGSSGGVDRDTLKTALTSQALLDQIRDSIPSTVQKATLDDGQILGKNMGMIKTHTELLAEIHELKNLLEQIENQYSQGPTHEIEKKLETAREKFEIQKKAKRHLAYQTWKKMDELDQQRENLNREDLQVLRDSIKEIEGIDRDIMSLVTRHKKENNRSKDYPWIETALEVWEEKRLSNKKMPPKYIGIAGLSGLAIGAVLLILDNIISEAELIWVGVGIIGLGLVLSLYYGIQILNWSSQVDDSLERKSILTEYEKRFSVPLQGLTDLKTRKSDLQKIYISAQATQSLLDEKGTQRKLQVQTIENSFASFSSKDVPETGWKNELAALTERSIKLDNEILENKLQLSKLDVPETAYNQEPTEQHYDPELILALDEEIHEIESDLNALQADLDNQKARACERTGDDIEIPWKEVLYNLQSLLENKVQEYKELTAGLIARIGLSEVLTQLREEEDQKIIQAINTDAVSDILYRITGRYQKLDLVNDHLIVHDAFSKYPLNDLSTGAREQVQLALRLGIASQVCGGDPLFLILDDAFQHSDWQRREALVKTTLELAKSGWQILYLSMDDHIRDLFVKEIKPSLKKAFKQIKLS